MAKFTIQSIFTAVDQLSGPVKNMRGQVSLFGKDARSSIDNVSKSAGMLKGAIIGVVTALTTGAAAKALGEFAGRGDDIARNAGILGLTAEAYQELSYAAKMADVEQDAFAAATKKLNNNLGQLKSGTGSLYSTLVKTNPQLARQLRTARDTDTAFQLVADALATETDVQKRAVIAQAAFGKTGQDLIPMMEDLAAARKKAREAGAVMTDEEVDAASRMDDALKKIKISGMGLANTALAGIAEKLSPIIERMTAWIEANKELIGQRIDQAIDLITGAGKLLTDAWNSGMIPAILAGVGAYKMLVATMTVLPAIIATVKTITFALAAVQGGAATATEALNFALASNPVGLVCVAVAALIGLITLMILNWKTVGPVLANVGQSFMKFILTPINLVISAIGAVLSLASKIPGIGGKFASAASGLQGFQDKMNTTLTGSAGTFDYGGVWNSGTPVSPNATGIESRSISESRSSLDVNFNGAPAGTTFAQSGRAPGITVNQFSTVGGGR